MKIERTVITGYRRFRLRQIHKFDYQPKKKTQVILGSNGSGKSSLIEELSPLPINTKDYEIGGGKEIWLSHHGKQYYLACFVKEDGNQFHFEVDGVNLNHGSNITGYRALVKEHFNYTKEIHQVLIGKVSFHAMSVNDRRNWFLSLSDVNYDYAIKYFKRLKDRIRGLQGALDRSQERLTQEIEKQLTPEKEIVLKDLVDRQKKDLYTLLDNKPPRKTDKNYTRYFESFSGKIRLHAERLGGFLKQHEAIGIPSTIESLSGLRNSIAEDLLISRSNLESKLDQVSKIQKRLTEIDGIGQHNLKTVLSDIAEHESKIALAKLSLSSLFDCTGVSASEALQSLNIITDQLLNIAERFQELSRRQCTQQEYHQVITQTQALQLRHQELTDRLKIATSKRQEHDIKKAADQVECPKCRTTWVPNYDAKAHAICLTYIDQLNNEFAKLEPLIKTNAEEKQLMMTILGLHDEVTVLFQRVPSLNCLKQQLVQNNLFELNPEQIPTLLNSLRVHLNSAVQIEYSTSILTERLKIKQLMESFSQSDKDKLTKQLEDENEQISIIQKHRQHCQVQLQSIDADMSLKKTIYTIYSEFLALTKERELAGKEAILENICQAIEETVYQLRLDLTESERRLSQVETHRVLIQTLQTEVAHLKREIILLKIAEEELSPSSGLIAKGMTSFINSFVELVNEEIERVWLYPLEICPVELNGDDLFELDYKFAVKVNGERVSSDIADTSSGMKEIINLAFVIASMQFLGLEDYPVYLDEFAVKMDAAHRSSAYRVIEQLIASDKFSQLFLISHYENGYSNLNDADITALCSANVVIPPHLTVNSVATIG